MRQERENILRLNRSKPNKIKLNKDREEDIKLFNKYILTFSNLLTYREVYLLDKDETFT